ncbi:MULTISPECIES: hypothetical protein [unclassified Mesorhizobium]|uniref:hypothetical protein n=1 Tax=unclassified Mesorhizobium TaxID=325217 RepID=UPI00241552FD|nr:MULTISPECIES: hypothetical protein [unclassified Mesorhizobium]MDG4852761.1 hypothetical protein [Mesorhizobium sp. WSM4982]MDG4915953.1 hypothetical protein [Mesorhizobium sp. WSM4983]
MTAPDPIRRLSKPPMPATRGLSRTLTADALLTDWGRSFRGREQIARWNQSDSIGVQSLLMRVAGLAATSGHVEWRRGRAVAILAQ